MPASGKTTLGALLAKKLDFAFMDTDNLIESLYASPLQNITDLLGKEKFLVLEGQVIQSISAQNCVIATGGSAIYSPAAISFLKNLGPLIYITAPLNIIEERIALNPMRGIAIAPGQSLQDLYNERKELYLKSADFSCDTYNKTPEECAQDIILHFSSYIKKIEETRRLKKPTPTD